MGKADKPEKSEKTNKKQNHFWKDFKAELKKVIWPTRSQVVNNTIVVLVIVIIVTAICFVLDFAFEALNTYGIDKLKTLVQNTVQTENVEDGTNTENSNTENVENTENTENVENTENSETENNEVANDTANVENVSE